MEQEVETAAQQDVAMPQQDVATENIEEATCMICEQQQSEGIHIFEEFICADCEREIVHTDVRDVRYPFFIHRMKQMFQSQNA